MSMSSLLRLDNDNGSITSDFSTTTNIFMEAHLQELLIISCDNGPLSGLVTMVTARQRALLNYLRFNNLPKRSAKEDRRG